jgi:hypothetical protein
LDASGQIPFLSTAGQGVQRCFFDTADGIREWMHKLATRLARVRLIHGDWTRCMNYHYGAESTAIFFDPPYMDFEEVYGAKTEAEPVALAVAQWAAEHPELKIAICGHTADYSMILPEWEEMPWSRGRLTYGSDKTTDEECIWFSPACRGKRQGDLFSSAGTNE